MYLPLVAIIALAVVGVLFVWRRLTSAADQSAVKDTDTAPLWRAWPTSATVTLLVVAALLGTRTIVRASEYRSALTLAETVLQRWPNANAQYLVGTELASAGRHGDAIPHLREAVRGYPPARFSLGSELVTTGKLDEAIAELQAFVIDEPHLVATRSARILMGRAFEAKQDWPHAIEQFRLILATDPNRRASARPAGGRAGRRARVHRSDSPLSRVPRSPRDRRKRLDRPGHRARRERQTGRRDRRVPKRRQRRTGERPLPSESRAVAPGARRHRRRRRTGRASRRPRSQRSRRLRAPRPRAGRSRQDRRGPPPVQSVTRARSRLRARDPESQSDWQAVVRQRPWPGGKSGKPAARVHAGADFRVRRHLLAAAARARRACSSG